MVPGGKRDIGKAVSPRNIKRFRPAFSAPASAPAPAQNSNVKVFVRVRPLNSKEVEKNDRNVIDVVDSTSLVFDPKESDMPFYYHGVKQKLRDPTKRANKNLDFTFDRVFDPEANNAEVFEHTTKSVIKTLLEGYNCTVFSYGATGAGKTYTMLGNDENRGIMYLTMVELYSELAKLKEDHDVQIYVAYVEVYNEAVHDLLDPNKKNLHLREDHSQVIISGGTTKEIGSEEELFQLLVEGNKNRTQHPTDANEESSRSHAVFQVFAKIAKKGTDQYKHFKLSMIDLAGSERAAATQNVRARFKEGSNINKSLLALGNVINALADRDRHRHIPYRDSKLTRILKDSLGGNCKTIMIANLSPAASSYEDSYNTLKYADRAKKIKSEVRKNVVSVAPNLMAYKKMCDEQLRELSQLKAQNQRLQNQLQNQGPPNPNCTCQLLSSERVKGIKQKLQQFYNDKDKTMKEILNLESQKQILQWRIKSKLFDLERVSELENGIESSGKGQSKLETTVAQLEGRLSGVMEAISEREKKLKENDRDIKNVIKDIKKIGIYDSLSVDINILELTLQNNDLEQRYDHGKKLSHLQALRLDDREKTLSKMSAMTEKYFLLLKAFNKVTSDMETEYKTVWNQMKAVSWDDSDFNVEQSLNNNFELRPTKLFTVDSAQSSPELPAVVVDLPIESSSNSVSISFNPPKVSTSSNLNGTFVMPTNPNQSNVMNSLKLPSPPKSMGKKSATSWKPRSTLSLRTKSPGQTPSAKFSQLNKENRPLPGVRMPPPSRTPRNTFKSVAAHLPTPGKTAILSTTMKKFGPSRKRNSMNKILPREASKRRSLLKTLADANQLSTVQFSKTPARFRPK